MTNKSNNDFARRLELCIMKNYYKFNKNIFNLNFHGVRITRVKEDIKTALFIK